MDLKKFKLETDRLLLIPVSMKYRYEVFQEFQEPVTKYMYPRAPKKVEETEEFIKKAILDIEKGTNLQVHVLDKKTGELLGGAGLHELNSLKIGVGIWIKKSAHGEKYGREAVMALVSWAKRNLKFDFLHYDVVKENFASRKIPKSLGAKIMKRYKRKMLSGRVYDMVEYWIYRDEI